MTHQPPQSAPTPTERCQTIRKRLAALGHTPRTTYRRSHAHIEVKLAAETNMAHRLLLLAVLGLGDRFGFAINRCQHQTDKHRLAWVAVFETGHQPSEADLGPQQPANWQVVTASTSAQWQTVTGLRHLTIPIDPLLHERLTHTARLLGHPEEQIAADATAAHLERKAFDFLHDANDATTAMTNLARHLTELAHDLHQWTAKSPGKSLDYTPER